MRRVVARNISGLAFLKYYGRDNIPLELAKDAGVSKSTVQRIMAASVGPSVDAVESLARALDVQPYQLLLHNLDLRHPQTVRGATQSEAGVYRLNPASSRRLGSKS